MSILGWQAEGCRAFKEQLGNLTCSQVGSAVINSMVVAIISLWILATPLKLAKKRQAG